MPWPRGKPNTPPTLPRRRLGRGPCWRRVPPTQPLQAGDQLSLCRPLRVDPKTARRQRFAAQGTRRAGLFAARRPAPSLATKRAAIAPVKSAFGSVFMQLAWSALTFDDVLLVPAHSQVLPKDTNLTARLSRRISLNLPLLSAAMDTVTEARLAIAMAQEGGMGIIHKNMSADEQAAQVSQSQALQSGVVRDPVVVTPQHSVRQVRALSEQLGVSGFPVVDGQRVVGIVTGRDLRFETRMDAPVADIMTPHERLITVSKAPRRKTPRRCCTSTSSNACWWWARVANCLAAHHRQRHHQTTHLSACRARRTRQAARMGAAVA